MQKYKNEKNKKKALDKLKIGRRNKKKRDLEKFRKYLENPKLCKLCGKKIPYKKRRNMFCSQSCGATFSNSKKPKRIRALCKQCGSPITKKGNVFCNLKCFHLFRKNIRKEDFDSGKMTDLQARMFFRRNNEKICSICNLSEWMGKEIPLEVDHIDGNSDNNFPNNLRFVCCNCAAQLDTYKAKNKGNGRKSRRI